jgi:imidazolonepropionase-like amidohydrolase
MSWDDALRSVSLAPAEAFGIADRYGALAVGRAANVVIWSGDPFEFSSRAERVLIRGVETSLHTRENELRERYRTRPPPR